MDTLAKVHGSFQRSDPPLTQFLPPESPMEMVVEPLRRFQRQAQASEVTRAAPRRAYLLAGTVFLTLAGCYEMYEVLQVGRVTTLEWIILVLFVLLFAF
jgi:membrane glycosyltransferase